MGIYWCAIDENSKEKIMVPLEFNNKIPGLFHPSSPFSGMVIMMNSYGHNFMLINDCDWEGPYYDDSYKDVTMDVYKRYIEYFPWAKDRIYEPKEDTK